MAFIVEQFTGDRGIQIGVEDVMRPFAFGTDWQKIRIGCRCAINGYAGLGNTTLYNTFSGGPRLGVCTGSLGALSASAVDAVWASPWRTGLVVLAGTPPLVYYAGAAATQPYVRCYQRVGSTTTEFGNSSLSGSLVCVSANPTVLRSNYFLDITKGQVGNSTIAAVIWMQTSVQVVNDRTQGDFLAAMENETAPTLTSQRSMSSTTLPTRFVKDWDTALVGWTRSTPTMCVYDLCVVRFS